MSDEIAQRQMIRDVHANILGRHLYKTSRVVVRIGMDRVQFRRPVAQVVRTDELAPFRVERNESDESKRMSTNSARHFVDARRYRSGCEQMDTHTVT